MFNMNDIFDIVTKWCGKEFGSNKISATSTGDDGVIEEFTITCFVDDAYVDIGAYSDPDGSKISIWTHYPDNVNIELNDTIKWNEEGGFHEFCGEAEMRKLYEAIQCSIHNDSKPDEITRHMDNDRSNKGIPYLSDINTMEDIKASVLEIVPRFNTASDILVLGMPYIVRNIKTGTTIIATMTSKSTDELTFNSWKGCFTIDAKTYHKSDTWKIYSANTNTERSF